MKKGLFVLKLEFQQVFRQTKSLLVVIFLVVLYETVLSPIKVVCVETGFSIGVYEPFILLCTRSTNIILIPLVYMVLLGGFPYCKTMYFQVIRTGKRQWFWGELAFVVLSSLAFVFVVFAFGDLFLLSSVSSSGSWSDFMTITRENFPKTYNENRLLFLEASIVAHGSPTEVMLYTFGTMWVNLIATGVVMLFGTIIGRRFSAMIVSAAMTVIGGLGIYFSGAARCFFPLVHVEYGLHFNSMFSQE